MPKTEARVGTSTIRSLLGMVPIKTTDAQRHPANVEFMNRYSKTEMSLFYNTAYVKPPDEQSGTTASGLISYLHPIHDKIGELLVDSEKMRALAPEIEQSRILVASSILSPNDLQEGEFIFSLDNLPGISDDPTLLKEILMVFSQHFNKTLELNLRAYDWLGDMQYGAGSRPILILPTATLYDAINRSASPMTPEGSLANQYGGHVAGTESFEQKLDKLYATDEDIYGIRKSKFRFNDAYGVSQEALGKAIIKDCIPTIEAFGLPVPEGHMPSDAVSQKITKQIPTPKLAEYSAGIESMVVTLTKQIEEGDVIRVSENPEIIKFATENKLITKKQMAEQLKKHYREKRQKIHMTEELLVLNPTPEGIDQQFNPTLIELPSEAVIPICIPGAPSEHLGYFILVGRTGQPLEVDTETKKYTNGSMGSINAAFDAMFGGTNTAVSLPGSRQYGQNTANVLFQNMLDKYMRSKAGDILGRGDVEISRFSAISTCMFYRLLFQKKTTVIFVPPTLLHYFAFAYKKNGTGKSKLEDIKTLLALRTTYLVATVMAMANDAVDHKKIEVGVDEKLANIEQVMDIISNAFTERGKLSGSFDPNQISQEIMNAAVTVVPKNFPGLTDLSIDTQQYAGSSTRVDNEMFERLTDLLIAVLDVPPAGLTQMSEPEFAKSYATTNLFFAKKIRRYSHIFCNQFTNMVRDYSQFSPVLQKAILRKLEAHGAKRIASEETKKLSKKTQRADNSSSETDYTRNNHTIVQQILDNISVSLPSPNIVVDNSQFVQIREYMASITELADNIFSTELIPTTDEKTIAALTIAKAHWKADSLKKFIDGIGVFDMVDIPDIEDFDVAKLTDFIQTLDNIHAGILRGKTATTTDSADDGGFGSPDSDGTSDDDSGFGFSEEGETEPENPQDTTQEEEEEPISDTATSEEEVPPESEATAAADSATMNVAQTYVDLYRTDRHYPGFVK